eukprot:1717297-Lingulodinium_polyedra.AAC.1
MITDERWGHLRTRMDHAPVVANTRAPSSPRHHTMPTWRARPFAPLLAPLINIRARSTRAPCNCPCQLGGPR